MRAPHGYNWSVLAAVFLLAGGGIGHAAVTYVDPPNITIPFSFGGVYLDIETAAENSSSPSGGADPSGDSYTISYSEPASGDWDVNIFFGGAFIAHNTTFQPYREDPLDNLSAIHNVGLNSEIDGGAIVPEPSSGPSAPLTTPDFGGSGTTTGGGLDGSQSPTHMGGATDQFTNGGTGYIAFVLNPGPSQQYGWMQVTLSDDGSAGTIHRWAYSDDPILVGVPEPSALALLGLGACALMCRRRS